MFTCCRSLSSESMWERERGTRANTYVVLGGECPERVGSRLTAKSREPHLESLPLPTSHCDHVIHKY